jgi:hypothetical protein
VHFHIYTFSPMWRAETQPKSGQLLNPWSSSTAPAILYTSKDQCTVTAKEIKTSLRKWLRAWRMYRYFKEK